MADDKKTSRLTPKRPDRELYVPRRRQPTGLISPSRSQSKESLGKRSSLESNEISEGKVDRRSSSVGKKREDPDRKHVSLKKSGQSRSSLHDRHQPEDCRTNDIVIQTAKREKSLESIGVPNDKADGKSSSDGRKREDLGRKQGPLEKSRDTRIYLQDVQQPQEGTEKEGTIPTGKGKGSLGSSVLNDEKVGGKASPVSRKRGDIGSKRSPLKNPENIRHDGKYVQKGENCRLEEIEVQTAKGEINKNGRVCKEFVGKNEKYVASGKDARENVSVDARRNFLGADERFFDGDDLNVTGDIDDKVRGKDVIVMKQDEAVNDEKRDMTVFSIAEEDLSIVNFAPPNLKTKETPKSSVLSACSREKSVLISEIGAGKDIDLQERNSPMCDELEETVTERSNADCMKILMKNVKAEEGHSIVNFVRELPRCNSTPDLPDSKLGIHRNRDVKQSQSAINHRSEQILTGELNLDDQTEDLKNISKISSDLEAERMLNDSDSMSFCDEKMDTKGDFNMTSELIENDVVCRTAKMVLENGVVKKNKRIGQEPTRDEIKLSGKQSRSAISIGDESGERMGKVCEFSESDLAVDSAKSGSCTENSLEQIFYEDTDLHDLIEVKNEPGNDSSMNRETESKRLDFNESSSEETKSSSEKSEKICRKEKGKKKFMKDCENGCQTKANVNKGSAKGSKKGSPGGRKMKVFKQEKKNKGKDVKDKTGKTEKVEDKKNILVEEMDCDVEENDDWEVKWDDNGDCLSSEAKSELEKLTGIEKPIIIQADPPEIDYFNFEPKQIQLDSNAFQHLVEIYDFSPDMKTTDICLALQTVGLKDFDIKWVDDTHAIGIFGTSFSAQRAIKMSNIQIKIRPVADATKATKLKVRSFKEQLLPYKPRPETTASVARNLVTSALGVKSNATKEQRAAERQKIKEAKERKQIQEKMKKDAWGED